MTLASIFSGLKAWFSSSSSIIGTSGIGGTLTALATHQVTLEQALPGLMFSIVAILMPQNAAGAKAAADVKQATSAIITTLADLRAVPAGTVSTPKSANDVR